jgi:hypothetical protein
MERRGWKFEAAQKRKLERTRRPIIAADIARFGEDETVIMRREGGWIRVYRAHHKADTMTTAGHIAKAMRDIDDEAGKNDWVRRLSTFRESAAESWTGWPSSTCRLCPTTAARHQSTRSGSSTLERRTTGHCGNASSRARSTSILMTTSSQPARLDQVGHRFPRTDQDRVEGRHPQAWPSIAR